MFNRGGSGDWCVPGAHVLHLSPSFCVCKRVLKNHRHYQSKRRCFGYAIQRGPLHVLATRGTINCAHVALGRVALANRARKSCTSCIAGFLVVVAVPCGHVSKVTRSRLRGTRASSCHQKLLRSPPAYSHDVPFRRGRFLRSETLSTTINIFNSRRLLVHHFWRKLELLRRIGRFDVAGEIACRARYGRYRRGA